MGTILVVLLVVFGIYWGISTTVKTSQKELEVQIETRRTYLELELELMNKYFKEQGVSLIQAYEKMCVEMSNRGYALASKLDDFTTHMVSDPNTLERHVEVFRSSKGFNAARDSRIVENRKSDYRRYSGEKYTRSGMEAFVYGRPMPKNRFEYDGEFKRSIWLMRNIYNPGTMVETRSHGLCQIMYVSCWENEWKTPIYTARKVGSKEIVAFSYRDAILAIRRAY